MGWIVVGDGGGERVQGEGGPGGGERTDGVEIL